MPHTADRGEKIKLMACFQIVCQNSFSGVIFLNSKIIFQTSLEKIFFFFLMVWIGKRQEEKEKQALLSYVHTLSS